jgi:hypothetical protein
MAAEDLSEEIKRFISQNIDSVEQLRVLAVLANDRARRWTVSELTQELRSAPGSIEKRLNDLYSRNVLVADPGSRAQHIFKVDNEQLPLLEDLLKIFELKPYRIIELIYTPPVNPLTEFANAFKIKKDGPK